ncbi:hypothetical protein ACLESD_36620 [Pyxidicoccus sp. 3LFB2]
MKRLVCIVEGHGELDAVPTLCVRVLAHLELYDWFVDPAPIRQKRSALVDARKPTPRPCREEEVIKAMELARRRSRSVDAVLLLCDEDDDCAATWGPHATGVMQRLGNGAAVMAVHEYETWLLLNRTDEELSAAGVHVPVTGRGAKAKLEKLIPNYSPTVHQVVETRDIDVAFLRTRSRSFDKLVHSIAALCGAPGSPAR